MPSIEVPSTFAVLTADGDATGYATVASTAGFYVGALGFIRNNAVAQRVLITEIKSATQLGLRIIADDNERQASLQVYGGRSNLSVYTTATTSKVFQESQLVRVDPAWQARQT